MFQYGIEFLVVHETHNGGFGIPPGQVAKNLVNGFMKRFDPLPEFAFADEYV